MRLTSTKLLTGSYFNYMDSEAQIIQMERNRPLWKKIGFAALIIGAVLFGSCRVVPAAEIPKNKAVLAIIGEAENQGFKGMLAVACAIRNKGNLHGVYGAVSHRVVHHLYSKSMYVNALLAWRMSKDIDITHGADHWENIHTFGCPYWVSKCIETFRYKDHIFFKEIV